MCPMWRCLPCDVQTDIMQFGKGGKKKMPVTLAKNPNSPTCTKEVIQKKIGMKTIGL